jgi:hypothetical protein
MSIIKSYKTNWFFGTFAAITFFLVFIWLFFTLSWATSDLGYSKEIFINAIIFCLVLLCSFRSQQFLQIK